MGFGRSGWGQLLFVAIADYIPAMAIADNAYSRFVFWLKVLLPLAALAILSTLFLVAETFDPEKAIPYADVDVEKILREQGVTRPNFGGVTSNGVAILVAAEAVRPDPERRTRLAGTGLSAEISVPNGAVININSPVGDIDADARTATLDGGAVLESSLGYRVTTEKLIASYKTVRVESAGTVEANGPGGSIVAGQMIVERRDSDGTYVLVFKDGVRLVYQPEP